MHKSDIRKKAKWKVVYKPWANQDESNMCQSRGSIDPFLLYFFFTHPYFPKNRAYSSFSFIFPTMCVCVRRVRASPFIEVNALAMCCEIDFEWRLSSLFSSNPFSLADLPRSGLHLSVRGRVFFFSFFYILQPFVWRWKNEYNYVTHILLSYLQEWKNFPFTVKLKRYF